MAPKLLLVSLLLAGTVLAVQSQLEPTRRIRFRPKIRRTTPAPEENAIGQELNLSKDEAKSLINKLKQSSSRRTALPPRRPGFNANKRTRFRRPQKIPLGRSRTKEATPVVETTTERKRDQFVPRLRSKNPSIPERPFKGQVIGGEITLDSGVRSPNEQIEVVKFKPTEAPLSNSGFEAKALEEEGSGNFSPLKNSVFDTFSQEREDLRERNEERDRLETALATEQPLENSIEPQTTERQRPLFKRPSDRAGVSPIRKAAKRRRGRPGARPSSSADAVPVPSPVSRPALSPLSRPGPESITITEITEKRPIAPATEASFTPSIVTEPRNTVSTEDPLEALLRRASSLTSSDKAVTTERVVEQPRNNDENEITDQRIGVRRRIPGRLGPRKNIKTGRRKASSSRDFIKQDRLRLRSRARVPIKRPAGNTVDSEKSGFNTRPAFRKPILNTIKVQESTPEGPNFSSFPSKSTAGSSRRPSFQPRIRVSQPEAPKPVQETVFRPSLDNQNIQTESVGSIGTIPITEAFSPTIPATEAFRDEIVIATSKPQPTTPFREEQTPLRIESTRAQPTARPAPRVQLTARPQPSQAEQRPRTTITRPRTKQIQSLGAGEELQFQIPLEFDPFSLTTPGTPARPNFTVRPFSSARATTPAPPRRVTQRPRTIPESPRSVQGSVQAVPNQQGSSAERPRQFANFGPTVQQISAPRRLPVPAPVPAQPQAPQRLPVPAQPQAPRRLPVPAQPQAPQRLPVPAQPQAPRRLPVPAQAQPPRRIPIPAQPQAPRRLPVPSQPQTPQQLSFPAQPQAPRRLPLPAPPQAPQSAPAVPQATSQAAVPASSPVSGITQLRNNNFAAFDRQFGGAVPFTAFRNTGSQPAAPQRVSANRFANPNIALLQNQNTVIQPQNSFQATPIQQAQQQSNPATSVIQRITPQQPQRVVPQNFQFPFQNQDQTFRIGGGQQAFQRFAPQQPFRFQATAASQNVQSFAPRPSTPQFQSSQGIAPPQQQPFQFQASASQNVPVAVRQPLNLPANTFFGHPAQNINLNTGSFSISTK